MAFCTTCGSENKGTPSFCGNCGASMEMKESQSDHMAQTPPPYQEQPQYQQTQQYAPQTYGYDPNAMVGRPPRTGWLTFVIVVNWIGVGFILLVAILLRVLAEDFASELEVERSALSTISIIFFILGGLLAWLTLELNKYNNNARIFTIVLLGLGLLSALGTANPISIILNALQIYALGFNKETIDLFKPNVRHY